MAIRTNPYRPGAVPLLLATVLAACAGKPDLTVAISLDIPPYVIDGASDGLERAIVDRALAEYELSYVQMPYSDLERAVSDGRADAAVAVQQHMPGVAYSAEFITFVNAAITRAADDIAIDRVADLGDHRVLTWEGADRELGDEFEEIFAPGSPDRDNYIEVADQRRQVEKFWAGDGDVIVIDRSIFFYFSEEMGHGADEVVLHDLFPPVTNFRAGFADRRVRDAFDAGLARLCSSGEYASLLDRYRVVVAHSICES